MRFGMRVISHICSWRIVSGYQGKWPLYFLNIHREADFPSDMSTLWPNIQD